MTVLYTLNWKARQRWMSVTLAVLCCGCGPQPTSLVQETSPISSESSLALTPEEVIEGVITDDVGAEPIPEPELTLKPQMETVKHNHPEPYIVKKGDNLWSIAARFFKNPGMWSQLWARNPQIQNPHLIYPGDAISVVYMDGQAHLQINGESGLHSFNLGDEKTSTGPTRQQTSSNPTVKLAPRLRRQAHEKTTQSTIERFNDLPQVVSQQQLDSAAYVTGNFDDRLTGARGDTVYALGITDQNGPFYSIFRHSRALTNPESKAVFGQELVFIADARVLTFGNPSALLITRSKRETSAGDILLPFDRGGHNYSYTPIVPEKLFKGTIISLFNANTRAAQNQVIIIDLGQRDGLERGHLLRLEKQGVSIGNTVALPDRQVGVVMICKVFEKVSYGLIMQSTLSVSVGDIATNL